MREHLRNDLLASLADIAPADVLAQIGRRFDRILDEYDVRAAERSLAVLGREEFERLIKTYAVVKRMEGLSDATLNNKVRYLRMFMMDVCKPAADINANDIRLYLYRYQERRGVSNRTLDRVRDAICSFFRWAACEGYLAASPVETIKPIKYEEKPRRALTQIELEMLRRACETKRELAILETLYSTGCRVSELVGIKMSDVDWDKKTVRLFGKGKKHRVSYINAKAEIAIKAYLAEEKRLNLFLFCNVRGGGQMKKENIERIMRKLTERAGLGGQGITPHSIRHTTATQALCSGMAVTDIQALLGHANVSTTMIYAHVSNDHVCAEHKRCII